MKAKRRGATFGEAYSGLQQLRAVKHLRRRVLSSMPLDQRVRRRHLRRIGRDPEGVEAVNSLTSVSLQARKAASGLLKMQEALLTVQARLRTVRRSDNWVTPKLTVPSMAPAITTTFGSEQEDA